MKFPLWRRRREDDLEEEIQGHLTMAAHDRSQRGETPQQAEAAARHEFGNIALVKEVTRAAWGWMWLEQLRQDLRYALRMLRRNPGFTAVAVLSLGLGIGANTAIFTVIDALMLRTLSVQSPEQLVAFAVQMPDRPSGAFFPYPSFEHFRDNLEVFSSTSAICLTDRYNLEPNAAGGGLDLSHIRVALVSGNYFSTLGVHPIDGRTLTRDDDRVSGEHPVAVISYAFWERRLGLASDVVGKTFTLGGITYSILGVTPAGFSGDWVGQPVDVWMPITMQPKVMPERAGVLTKGAPLVRIIARLKSAVRIEQAQAAAQLVFHNHMTNAIGGDLSPREMEVVEHTHLDLLPLETGFSPQREYLARPLAIVTVVVGLVLLIACSNIAGLLLARSAAREREVAVRLAIGASRARVVRQLLTESFLLVMVGAMGGLFIASWGSSALLKIVRTGSVLTFYGPMSTDVELHPNVRILAFTGAISLLAGLLFGLVPALGASRASLGQALKGLGTGSSGSRARFSLGKAIVIFQVALSLLLVVLAGLFARTLRNLRSQDLGFDLSQVLLISCRPDQEGRKGADLAGLFSSVQERLSLLPGVSYASPSSGGLMSGDDNASPVTVQGFTPGPGNPPGVQERFGRGLFPQDFVRWNLVAPRFFETVGMPMTLGRDFGPQDTEAGPRVAIINETMAHYYFGEQSPIGKRFDMRGSGEIEIVGVVMDAKYDSPREENQRMIYIPYRQDLNHLQHMCVAVRMAGNPHFMAALIRDELYGIDRRLPVTSIVTMEEQLNASLVQERVFVAISGFFGAMAVLLACIGLYGVVSYTAARRTNEIAVRLALWRHARRSAGNDFAG